MQFVQIMPPICKICTGDFADAAIGLQDRSTGSRRAASGAAARGRGPGPGRSSCSGRVSVSGWQAVGVMPETRDSDSSLSHPMMIIMSHELRPVTLRSAGSPSILLSTLAGTR